MKRIIVAISVLLSGCTALETRETQAWLVLHAVDTAQTYRIAQDSHCYMENDPITRALIGDSPSRAEVLAWSAGMAGMHVGVTELLLRTDHPKIAKAWQYFRIGVTASAIGRNHEIGIRIGSPNRPNAGACAEPEQAPAQHSPRPIG